MYCVKTESDYIFTPSVRFIKVSPTSGCFIGASKEEAQGVAVESVAYSTNPDAPMKNAIVATLVPYEEWDEDITSKYEEKRCKEAKEIKITELSKICNELINAGDKVQLSEEVTESFTYDINDQANISEMATAVTLGADAYPYHANEAECRMYQSPEIIKVYSTLSGLKTHHLTYFNQLKAYVNSLTKADDVYSIEYGQELTGQYLEKYNSLMAQAQAEMEKVLANMSKPSEQA